MLDQKTTEKTTKRVRCGYEFCCNAAEWHIEEVQQGYSQYNSQTGKSETVITGSYLTGLCDQHHTKYFHTPGKPFTAEECHTCFKAGV